jgi:hypothetical protein
MTEDLDELKRRIIEQVPSLTSDEVAQLGGASWREEGKVFALPTEAGEVYPAFQFKNGAPLPVIELVLAHLPPRTPWQVAAWFVSTNGWLGDEEPMNVLDDDLLVLGAAVLERDEFIG